MTSPAPCPAEVPSGRLGHLDPVGHGDHVLGVARQIAGPLLNLVGLCLSAEKNHAVQDLDLRRDEPAGGLHDALEALADLLVLSDWLHGHLCRRERKLLFRRSGWILRPGRVFLRHDRRIQRGAPKEAQQHRPPHQ